MAGRIDYISNPKRQEYLYATYQTEGATPEFWKNLARENQLDFKARGTAGKCIEGREFIIALPESFVQYRADDVVRLFTEKAHLALNDGAMFGKPGEGFMRLNVGCPRSVLQTALRQLSAAVKEEKARI